MISKAAVAVKAGSPLEIVDVNIGGPRAGEVLVEIMATGICHTDEFTLSGADPEGIFPAILGHEGAGIVREIGPEVTSLKVGDHVIPLYTPEKKLVKKSRKAFKKSFLSTLQSPVSSLLLPLHLPIPISPAI